MNWQPISSAPRDGTFILLAGHSEYHSTALYALLGQWSHSRGGWTDYKFVRLAERGLVEPIYWCEAPGLPGTPSKPAREAQLERELELARQTIGYLQDELSSLTDG